MSRKRTGSELNDVPFQFTVDTAYLNVHCDVELLAERNIFNFNQVKVRVFFARYGERVVLLGLRYPPHSVEHRQPLIFGALFR